MKFIINRYYDKSRITIYMINGFGFIMFTEDFDMCDLI